MATADDLASKNSDGDTSLCSTTAHQYGTGDDYTNTPLYKAFMPLMFSLNLLGLHHHRRIDTEKSGHSRTLSACQIYCWTVTIVSWLLVIRCVATLRFVDGFGPQMLSNLSLLVWLFLCASNSTTFLKSCHSSQNERKFFHGFTKLNRFGGSFVCPIKTKKYIFCGTIITWVVVCFNLSVGFYLIFRTKYFDLMILGSVTESNTGASITLKAIYCFFLLYLTPLWIFPSTLQMSVSILLYQEFNLFRDSFRSKMSKDKRYLGTSIELERRRFLLMLRIVEAADGCMSLHQSASIVCDIAKLCLLLYNIIYYPSVAEDPVVVGVSVFWLVYDVIDLSVVIISGVIISSSVSIR